MASNVLCTDSGNSTNFYGVFTVDTSSLSSLLKAQIKGLNVNSTSLQTSSLIKKTFLNKIKIDGPLHTQRIIRIGLSGLMLVIPAKPTSANLSRFRP